MTIELRIFLAGPPGVGKSTLLPRIGDELEIDWKDLSVPGYEDREALDRAWSAALAGDCELVALDWRLAEDPSVMRTAREEGLVVGIWDHPENMNERARRPIPYDPVREMKRRGGLGNTGKATNEYKRLKRKSDEVVDLVDRDIDEAADRLTDFLEWFIERANASPVERAGLVGWCDDLQAHHGADPEAAEVLVERMAEYMVHLKEEGASDRKMRGVYSDLQAAAQLVFSYRRPGPDDVLDYFSSQRAPNTIEYDRKYSSSERVRQRYRRHARAFGEYLEELEGAKSS